VTWKAVYIKHDLNSAMDLWCVQDLQTKRTISGLSCQEAHAIMAALNTLEQEVCYE